MMEQLNCSSLTLLMLTCMVLEAVAHFDNVTLGESGVMCTSKGARCLTTTSCVRKQCHCRKGSKGNGLVECVRPDELLCTVTNDFIVKGFGESDDFRASYPCVMRLTAFIVDVSGAKESKKSCHFDVLGVPYTHPYENLIMGFVVRLKVLNDGSEQFLDVLEIGATSKGFFMQVYPSSEEEEVCGSRWTGWGREQHIVWRGIKVLCTFDTRNNFAILTVPECGTRVKLRPADVLAAGKTGQTPTITIQAPPNARWNANEIPEVRYSLCGLPSDRKRYWREKARAMHVELKRTAALHDTLLQGPGIAMFAATFVACQMPSWSLKSCPREQRNRAVRLCGPIITHKYDFACLLDSISSNNIPVTLYVFDHCLKFVCMGHVQNCKRVKKMLDFKSNCPGAQNKDIHALLVELSQVC